MNYFIKKIKNIFPLSFWQTTVAFRLYLFFGLITFSALGWILLPTTVFGQYENIKNAFIISPTKQEIKLSGGESVIRNIYVTNKFNYDADFVVTVEDVSGSNLENEVIKYYGKGLGPYSIRNYIIVENDHIRIPAGQTKVIPVLISLPAKIKPGGLYGGIFVSLAKEKKDNLPNVSSRAGSLIFLKIKGDVEERGLVKNFGLSAGKKIIWNNKPVDFQVSFENTGNIYLNPYGVIEVKNLTGKVIDRLPIDPWFVFPDSVRTRLITSDRLPLFGYFTATLTLNHGYTVSKASVLEYNFLIIPLPIIIGILFVFLIGFIFYKTSPRLKKWQI